MMSKGGGDRSAHIIRREAAAWIARMNGPDADLSRLEFERWRARDPRNRAAYAGMEQISRLSRALGDTPLGRAHREKVNRRPFFAMPVPRLAVASLVVLMLVGAGALFLVRRVPLPVTVAFAEGRVTTPVGTIRSVRLSDGTTVTLDTDSAIDTLFTQKQRIVRLLRGRARFDVAHEARRFLVEVSDRTVVARGTLFDIDIGREGVRVTLLRGAVDVRDRRSRLPAAPPLARLVPGQVFAETAAPGHALVGPAPAGGDKWVDGMLSFDGAPLSAVLDQANRYSGQKIRLGEPGLATLHVTGMFRAAPAADLADILAASFGLRVERTPQGDFVLRRG